MNYVSLFNLIKNKALQANSSAIDEIMEILDSADLPTTRAVDLYLGTVTSKEGIERIRYYLFSGSQIQRNYCTLFFSRRNDWDVVNEAYNRGCIDHIQAYSR